MKEKDIIYEDVLTTGLTQPLVDTGIDYIEMGVDYFVDNEVVKEIPVVKTFVSLLKFGMSIKERHFIKKLLTFLHEFHSKKLSSGERETFLANYNSNEEYRNKVVTFVVTSIDRFFDAEQAKIKGNLFVAHIKGLLEWEDYVILCGCLDRFQAIAKDSLDEMEKQKEPYHAMYGNVFDPGMSILLSCGMAINQAHHFFVNILGILIHQYGIKADFSHSVEEIKKSTWVGMEHTIENGWAPISNKK